MKKLWDYSDVWSTLPTIIKLRQQQWEKASSKQMHVGKSEQKSGDASGVGIPN